MVIKAIVRMPTCLIFNGYIKSLIGRKTICIGKPQ